MRALASGLETPLFAYRNGVVYRVGLQRRVAVPPLAGDADLATWLHGLGKALARQLSLEQFELDPAGVGQGYVVVTVRTPEVAVGRRPRGKRGAGKRQRLAA